MDPVVAAAGRIVGYLVPYALDKTADLAAKLGKSAVDKIGGWLDRLRERWAGDDDAGAVLADFERDPEANEERLLDVLADRMRVDSSLQEVAEELAAEVGPTVVVTMRGGRVAIQNGPKFGDVLRGRVSVDISLQEGDLQDGGTFGDIG
jgi:hypothetical protein